jgi:TPR repeat protein
VNEDHALFVLGEIYSQGYGDTEKDLAKAEEFYRKAAQMGHKVAERRLAHQQ